VTQPPDRASAEALDAADPLAAFRSRFPDPEPDRLYLDGNSLGRLSTDVEHGLAAAIGTWRTRAVEGWAEWVELPRRVGDRLADLCLGAAPGEVLVTDSTTVNLYKLAHAALDLRPQGVVATDADNFPTDRYVLEGVAAARGRRFVLADSVEGALQVPDAALLCLSHVDYRTGRRLDLGGITRASEAMVVWDLSHSVGAVAIDLSGADLAVGCSYKYLNAGPGGPAFLYVRRELQDALTSPVRGWFGQRDQFAMGPAYEPAPGIDRLMAGTPPVLATTALDAALDVVAEAGMAAIERKAASLTDLAITLADAWLAELGFEVVTPRSPTERGAHVALRHPEAWPICRALIERVRVVGDFRQPDILRLGFSPLYISHTDAWDAMDRIRTLVAAGVHRDIDAQLRRVT
jgi:kynureninase